MERRVFGDMASHHQPTYHKGAPAGHIIVPYITFDEQLAQTIEQRKAIEAKTGFVQMAILNGDQFKQPMGAIVDTHETTYTQAVRRIIAAEHAGLLMQGTRGIAMQSIVAGTFDGSPLAETFMVPEE